MEFLKRDFESGWVPPRPLPRRVRFWIALVLGGIVLLWVMALQTYGNLPESVPVHFGIHGKADHYGPRGLLLFLAGMFSLIPALLLFMVRIRFVLVNRWPTLLNLPGFFQYAVYLPSERRAEWYNRYFEALVYLDVALVVLFLVTEWGILEGIRTGQLPTWFTPVVLGSPLLLLIPLLYYTVFLSHRLRQEVRQRAGF